MGGQREEEMKSSKKAGGEVELSKLIKIKRRQREREPDRQLHGSSLFLTSSENSTLNRDGNSPRLSQDPSGNHLEAIPKLIWQCPEGAADVLTELFRRILDHIF